MAQMTVVSIDPSDRTPIYAQLERGFRAAIASGRLRPGDQLPTVRQLAVELRVNANTVARVYSELERAGVLETRRGAGSFISAPGRPGGRPAGGNAGPRRGAPRGRKGAAPPRVRHQSAGGSRCRRIHTRRGRRRARFTPITRSHR